MNRFILVPFALAFLCLFTCPVCAATLYVDASVAQSGDGATWETAFQKIQEGIDVASDGDTVMVAPGVYIENIHFHGKNITLTSADPLDSDIVAGTILDGNRSGTVVSFSGMEDQTCVLSGFTVHNGSASDGGGICGGNWYNRAGATIEHNVITGNRAWDEGGGVVYCDGIIQNNVIHSNLARKFGGGLYACDGVIRGNTIGGNSVDELGGGGLSGCDGVIEGNCILDNTTAGCGGGLYGCDGMVRNNVICRNSARIGGGMYNCNGSVHNNTIYGNSAEEKGGGLDYCNSTTLNCIIWGNKAQEEPQLHGCTEPNYSCIERWTGGGSENIWYAPHFADPDSGDLHLTSWSPCVDAGDPASAFAKESAPNGGRINMGAYGNTPEATSCSADSDGDALPDEWELKVFGTLLQGAGDDPDGDLIRNIDEYYRDYDPTALPAPRYVDASVSASGDGKSWETAFKRIQEGIDAASGGDAIIVAQGTYFENIHFNGKVIRLSSTDPLDPDIVAATVIDGNQAGSVVAFDGTEKESCILSGFTIRNGRTGYAAGICGGSWDNHTRATIRNNVIVANSADQDGGGLAYCDGQIGNNLISNNCGDSGGGLFRCDGLVDQNTITGNVASYAGGALAECAGHIRGNTIIDNTAAYHGGGLADCGGVIEANDISYNTTERGYGGGLFRCPALIQENTISNNGHSGLYRCDCTIRNNTIARNYGWYDTGGGLTDCDGLIQNNIIVKSGPRGLYDCDGTIEGNTITINGEAGLFECDGLIQGNRISGHGFGKSGGGGLAYCDGTIQNNLILGNIIGVYSSAGLIRNNTVVGNHSQYFPAGLYECTGIITNCIIWANEGRDGKQIPDWTAPTYSCIQNWTGGGQGNISEDPRFVDPDGPDNRSTTYEDNDYRLRGDSPCIDVGCNEADLPAFDLAGMRRVMYGGKSFTVDMGAYEYYINELTPGPGTDKTTLTWSSIAGSTYVILYSNDLLIWILAEAGVPSAGNQTTSWIDDGSSTGVAPTLAPLRFYRILENP